MKKKFFHLTLVLATINSSGCGLKGPLYLPQYEQPKSHVILANTMTMMILNRHMPRIAEKLRNWHGSL